MTIAATPAVLVIALAANEASSPRSTAIIESARDVLGEEVVLRVEAVDPSGPVGEAGPDTAPSSGYAWITWDSANANLAHLHCFIPASRRWVQRDVAFAPQDPPLETGRTLGFVIASIYLGNEPRREAPPASVPTRPLVRKPVVANTRHFIVQGAVSLALPNDAMSVGGWLGAQWQVARSLSLGLAGDARFGTVDSAQSSTRFIAVGALGTYRTWPTKGNVWLGPQVFLGTEQLRFSHFSADDAHPVEESSWIPRVDALLMFNWEITESSLLFVGLGTNYRFGETDVFVRGQRRAHIPAWAELGRLGFGTRF
jgi:hypothetical protein